MELEALYKQCDKQNIVLNDEKKDVGKSISLYGHTRSQKKASYQTKIKLTQFFR